MMGYSLKQLIVGWLAFCADKLAVQYCPAVLCYDNSVPCFAPLMRSNQRRYKIESEAEKQDESNCEKHVMRPVHS